MGKARYLGKDQTDEEKEGYDTVAWTKFAPKAITCSILFIFDIWFPKVL